MYNKCRQPKPTIQVADNEGSLADAGRHVETRDCKLSESVEHETVILKYTSTERQVADLLTKSFAKIAFERLRDGLGWSHSLDIHVTIHRVATYMQWAFV